ncbi:MAG TPA: CoA transferase [Deltaproteobacteria bacterium]|nr:CoA transferase [Deltaproteobacteria bacterium]
MPGILDGVRIIDMTQFISGSRCTQLLADMGATVVHVEPREGQTLRLIFSLVPGAERNFSIFNRNKYGLSLDWRLPDGREILLKLARMSDIFVHNLIPGTLERHGLGYEDLKAQRPDIIHIAISGFGEVGVNPDRAAFDIIAQAVSGQFWNDQEDLRLPCNYWADLVSGAYAANAVLLALINRMKTGAGGHVDISMQDVLYTNNYRAMVDKCMGPIMAEVEKTLGRKPRDVLNSEDRMPFYGFFKTTDGKVAIVALTQRQWQALSEVVGSPELADDPRFNTLISQIHNHDEAVEIIEKWTSGRASREVIQQLEARRIPCGTAYTIDQVNRDENLKERGMFARVKHARFGDVDVPGIPYRFTNGAGEIRMPGPDLGEHNDLILRDWLGYSPGEIEALRTAGVIR